MRKLQCKKKSSKLLLFSLPAWLLKRPIFGRNGKLLGSLCLLSTYSLEQTYTLGLLHRISISFQNMEVNINKENWISKQQYTHWAEQKHYAAICIKKKETKLFLRPILVKSYALPRSQSCLADKNPLFLLWQKESYLKWQFLILLWWQIQIKGNNIQSNGKSTNSIRVFFVKFGKVEIV